MYVFQTNTFTFPITAKTDDTDAMFNIWIVFMSIDSRFFVKKSIKIYVGLRFGQPIHPRASLERLFLKSCVTFAFFFCSSGSSETGSRRIFRCEERTFGFRWTSSTAPETSRRRQLDVRPDH